MPELPEVETIRRQLSEVLPGQTITEIQVLSEKSFQGDPATIIPSKVVGIRRAGKGLIIDLEITEGTTISRHPELLPEMLSLQAGDSGSPAKSANKSEASPTEILNQVQDDTVSETRNLKPETGNQHTSKNIHEYCPQLDWGSNSFSLVIHLKMTGQLIYDSATHITTHSDDVDPKFDHRIVGGHPTKDFIADLPSSHTRVIFTLSDSPVIARSEATRQSRPNQDSPASAGISRQARDDNKTETVSPASKPETGNQHTSKNIHECCPQLDWGSKSLNHLYFNDQRKFGWIKLVPTADVEKIPFIAKLGPEPWDISLDGWYKFLQSSRKAIKVRLLDQDKVAGIGNIYANDALWEAQIDPSRPANSLTSQESQLLLEKVKQVMDEGIFYGGATAADGKYVDLGGLGGTYQEHFRTYDRAGESCKRPDCNGTIEKITLGGRGTYFCPTCQL